MTLLSLLWLSLLLVGLAGPLSTAAREIWLRHRLVRVPLRRGRPLTPRQIQQQQRLLRQGDFLPVPRVRRRKG